MKILLKVSLAPQTRESSGAEVLNVEDFVHFTCSSPRWRGQRVNLRQDREVWDHQRPDLKERVSWTVQMKTPGAPSED